MTEMSKVTQHVHRDDAKLDKDAASLLQIIRRKDTAGVFDFPDEVAAYALATFYKTGRADTALADAIRTFLEPYKVLTDGVLTSIVHGDYESCCEFGPHIAAHILALRKLIAPPNAADSGEDK